ncbi:MAG: hypothetical protein ISS70_01240 [Phycisphaerae bacterium]|nr:hypothetical protein [Phycisphaerae bacterium]
MTFFEEDRNDNRGKVEKVRSGLKIFERNLHPEVVDEIGGWAEHPELSKLLEKLESIRGWEQFLDHYAEALIARHLIGHGCELEVEVPTINGKKADFRVSEGNQTFYIHVKRLNFDKEMRNDLKVGTRLDSLRREGFGFSFSKSLTDDEMQQFCKEAFRLSKELVNGESKEVTSKTGEMLGECHRMKRGQSITIYSAKDGDCSDRFLKKLKSAYRQFMPDCVNVILVRSAWRDDDSIESLRESADDFWSDGGHPCSSIVGWFVFDPRGDSVDFELFFRENFEKPPHIGKLFRGDSLKRKRLDESV